MQIIDRQTAKEQGLKRFFTGAPCNMRGHVSERLVSSGSCIRCTDQLSTIHKNLNREAKREQDRNYNKENRALRNAIAAEYRAAKIRATPKWRDKIAIKKIYAECTRISLETGIVHHVNHIVALNAKFVCGLHVEFNLEIITGSKNCSLSNRHESDNWQD